MCGSLAGAIDIAGIAAHIKLALQDLRCADLCKEARVAIIAYFEHTRTNVYASIGTELATS